MAIETVDFLIENGDFPVRYVCLPESNTSWVAMKQTPAGDLMEI